MRAQSIPALAAFLLAAIASAPDALRAQGLGLVAGDGWEAFLGVSYRGGDARFTKKHEGALILTDSTLGFYPCASPYCEERAQDAKPWKEPAYFVIPLENITGVQSSAQVRGPGLAGRIMLGFLAGDREQGSFAVVYETVDNVEVPLFTMTVAQTGALDAKLRYRLERADSTGREQ